MHPVAHPSSHPSSHPALHFAHPPASYPALPPLIHPASHPATHLLPHTLPGCATPQGLSYLAARDLLGHEALIQADLLLKLAAGRALAAMGGVPTPGPAGYTDVWVYRALQDGG